MRLMLDENEDAFAKALNEDLHRSRAGALMAEMWDVVGQVGFYFYFYFFLSCFIFSSLLVRPPAVCGPRYIYSKYILL